MRDTDKKPGKMWESLPFKQQVVVIRGIPLRHIQELSKRPGWIRVSHAALRSAVRVLLRTFHLPGDETLGMMQITDTVLSGSAVLKVVDAANWTPGDLDFYCPRTELRPVLEWFRRRGYKVTKAYDAPYDSKILPNDKKGHEIRFAARSCIKKVIILEHKIHGTILNLIQSLSTSALAPLTFFHSTLVMNFISGHGIVCGYPELTFKGIGKAAPT